MQLISKQKSVGIPFGHSFSWENSESVSDMKILSLPK
jgi:hypothetical protein